MPQGRRCSICFRRRKKINVTVKNLIEFLQQLPDQSATVLMISENEQCSYRPVAELVQMAEGRVVIAAPGDYDRIVAAQQKRKDAEPTLELAGASEDVDEEHVTTLSGRDAAKFLKITQPVDGTGLCTECPACYGRGGPHTCGKA